MSVSFEFSNTKDLRILEFRIDNCLSATEILGQRQFFAITRPESRFLTV